MTGSRTGNYIIEVLDSQDVNFHISKVITEDVREFLPATSTITFEYTNDLREVLIFGSLEQALFIAKLCKGKVYQLGLYEIPQYDWANDK